MIKQSFLRYASIPVLSLMTAFNFAALAEKPLGAATLSAAHRRTAPKKIQHDFVIPPLSEAEASTTLIYHVRTGQLELDNHIYPAGSGNRNGFNNPAYEHVNNRGPIPRGAYNVQPREKPFHGFESWRIKGTPGRAGILIHPDTVQLKGRPTGESEGCIAISAKYYDEFCAEMHKLNPKRIIVRPT